MAKMNGIIVLVAVSLAVVCCAAEDPKQHTDDEKKLIAEGEKKISEHVLVILEHYKQEDPVGLPGAPIPDPMPIPPLSHSFAMGKMNMKDVQLRGLAQFRIHHVDVNLAEMQVEAALTIEKLIVNGNYTLGTWLSRYAGPFTVKLKDVFVQGISRLEVNRVGKLDAQEMKMDITFKNIDMNFEGLGVVANMFQGLLNSMGTFIFDSIKPFILAQVNTDLRKDINKQLQQIPQKFPNSISPFDQIMAEMRKKVRDMGYDPYKITDYNHTLGLIGVQMSHTWVTGISSFHRIGDIIFRVKNNTVHAHLDIGTQKIEGTSNWEISLGAGMLARAGSVAFTVEYIKVQLELSQSMDTRNTPVLEDIQLELGNIQVRCDGAGTLDYVIEIAVNILPNILRYQIMDALESPIKMRIQEELNGVNVEKLINENLAALDEQQKTGFKGML